MYTWGVAGFQKGGKVTSGCQPKTPRFLMSKKCCLHNEMRQSLELMELYNAGPDTASGAETKSRSSYRRTPFTNNKQLFYDSWPIQPKQGARGEPHSHDPITDY